MTQFGILAFQRGRYGVARGHYERALAVARAAGNRAHESGLLNNLGEIERLLGNYDAAFDLFQAGRRLCGEIGQRLADAYLLCNVAHVAFLRGDATGSIRWAPEAMQLGEELKDRDLQATLSCVRAHAHVALGEWDAAAAGYRASLALFREIGRATMVPEPIAGLARIALARGDVDGARTTVAEVIAHFDAGGSSTALRIRSGFISPATRFSLPQVRHGPPISYRKPTLSSWRARRRSATRSVQPSLETCHRIGPSWTLGAAWIARVVREETQRRQVGPGPRGFPAIDPRMLRSPARLSALGSRRFDCVIPLWGRQRTVCNSTLSMGPGGGSAAGGLGW